MSVKLVSLSDLDALPFDQIVDVRSPSEFSEDHIPGAINLPALDDAERARIGTIYVQEDRFRARRLGAALLARNVAHHLETTLADCGGGWRPLVYCWRGGQRSGGVTTIFDQIGWRAEQLDGGYKAYRRLVVDMLYHTRLTHRVVLLAGGTGTGKTALLARLADAGAQVLDLEALARHRGSLFGGDPADQPAQKRFESDLAAALTGFDPAEPVFIEAESGKIGARILPPALRDLMQRAQVVEVTAPAAARAAYLCELYAEDWAGTDKLRQTLDALRPFHAAARIADWQQLARQGKLPALVTELIAHHYDTRYALPVPADTIPVMRLELPDLSPASLDTAAARIGARFNT